MISSLSAETGALLLTTASQHSPGILQVLSKYLLTQLKNHKLMRSIFVKAKTNLVLMSTNY